MSTEDSNEVVLSIPTTAAPHFKQLWKDLRLAEGLNPDADLPEPVEVENFDGATMVEWIVELAPALAPIFTGAIGYLVASRGEIEYEYDGEKIRMKNVKPSKMKEVLQLLDERNAKRLSDTED